MVERNAHDELCAALALALDDVGLAPDSDDQIVEQLLDALREHGYVIVRAVNSVHPDTA